MHIICFILILILLREGGQTLSSLTEQVVLRP